MDSFLQKFSLQNLLRQFFCGVVFFVPLWLFARTRIVEILGVEKGNTGVYLIFSALAYIVGTAIYHLEKNLHSYPLQLIYEYYYQKVERWKILGLLILIILALGSLCIGIYCWWMLIIAAICYFVLAIILLCSRQERLVKTTMDQWIWEEKGALTYKAIALPICSDERLTPLAAMKKISTWTDFIHCVVSCCFAWIFGCVVVKMLQVGISSWCCLCVLVLLLIEGLIDAHRYRFVKRALQNASLEQDSQTCVALTSEKEYKSSDDSIFTQADKCDSPEVEENMEARVENFLSAFENKFAPSKIQMMTTEKLSELLETEYKSGKNTANKKIIFGILSFVKTCLGDEVLLRLLQKMEKCGDSIAWAADVTNKSLQEQEEIRVPNGNPQQARYYREALRVCDKGYLVSSQWYTCKGDNEQTIKELLDMVVDLSIEELHSHIKKQ